MSKYFCVSVTFLDGRFHGRIGDGEPEWPPSPLRLFQAIVAANALEIRSNGHAGSSLRWLECQLPPLVVAPNTEIGNGYVLSVPNNSMDLVAKAWSKGDYFGSGDSNPTTHRAMKLVRPVHMLDNDTIHYVWPISDSNSPAAAVFDSLIDCAKGVFTLGWGVDLVATDAMVLDEEELGRLEGQRWAPKAGNGGRFLRAPRQGTLDALCNRHDSFLGRITPSGFVPVDPLTEFVRVGYRNSTESLGRPYVVFELRNDDSTFFTYPQRKLIHIAGMTRHLAIETMKDSPPPAVDNVEQWIDRYVAGHQRDYEGEHRQFSYLPLPSIGHRYADQAVRRVIISAPIGDDHLLDHLASRLDGVRVRPANGTPIGSPPTLIRAYQDKVAARYTSTANIWASVTPVVLPGHTDRKPAKTVKLIEKALRQSGIDQPCTFEWRAVSWWPKSLPAYKYGRDKNPVGYIRPDYLEKLSLVHIKLVFDKNLEVPGPLVIGAGRHCGFGLLAAVALR